MHLKKTDPARRQCHEKFRNFALVLTTVVLTLGLAELALRVFDLPRQPMKPEKTHDPVLVYRIPSSWPGVDKDGFRNRAVPLQADIVTLGDSHTYGLNADLDTNWPGHLSKLTRQSVYNLGIGGYGPLQYYYLFDRALQLSPKTIILGLYLPNDIKGVCHPYQQTSYWKKRALSEKLDLTHCSSANFDEGEPSNKNKKDLIELTGQLLENSKIWSLVSIAARQVKTRLPQDEKRYVIVSRPGNKTIMGKSRLRDLYNQMDLDNPEINKNLSITETLVKKMATRANAAGVHFVVLVIPSKEFVFHQYLIANPDKQLPDVYHRMAKAEHRLRDRIFTWLKSEKIPYANALPDVLNALKGEGSVYPADNDGHPTGRGYKAYADAVYKAFYKAE